MPRKEIPRTSVVPVTFSEHFKLHRQSASELHIPSPVSQGLAGEHEAEVALARTGTPALLFLYGQV